MSVTRGSITKGVSVPSTVLALTLGPAGKLPSVKAVISLAHGLGLIAVAEGVETAEQRDILRAYGCDQFQGYLFSRPRYTADIAALLTVPAQPIEDYLAEAGADALIRAIT